MYTSFIENNTEIGTCFKDDIFFKEAGENWLITAL